MSALIEQYAGEHFRLNSISLQRQEQVLVALNRLEVFAQVPIQDVTDMQVRAWLISLLDQGLAPSTVCFYLRAVGPFYHWAWQRRLIDAEQLLRLRDVSPPRGSNVQVPRPYSHKELMVLWERLDTRWPYATDRVYQRWLKGTSPFRSVKKHAMRLQLNAIIELALVCGLRRIEIMRLSLDDCHWDNKYIVVHGKRINQNPKVREVPYPDSTRNAIRAWIRMRVRMEPPPGLPLWLSITGPNPVAALSVDRSDFILRSLGDFQMHRLRHTCATERLKAGMELEKLQRFLGHATIAQTLRYAELVRSDIHKATARTEDAFQRAIRPDAARCALNAERTDPRKHE